MCLFKDVRCYGIFKLGIKELYRRFVHQREVGGSHGDCYTDFSVLESDPVYSDRNLPTFSGSGCLHIWVRTGTFVQKRNTRVVFFFPAPKLEASSFFPEFVNLYRL